MSTKNFVNTLLTTYGQDALSNQFYVNFNPLSIVGLGGSWSDQLAIRTLTCSIPAQTISTYEVVKRGRKFSRPSGVSEQSYEFSFTYRVDQNYKTYRLISDWMKIIQAPVTMASSTEMIGDVATSWRIPITVTAADSLDRVKAKWIMEGAFPVEQDAIEFDEENGDPLVLSVTMHFQNILYPLSTDTIDETGMILSPANSELP